MKTDLTPRHLEVIEKVVDGKLNKEIADALGISNHCVKNHLTHIYVRLGINTRTELAVKALRDGLVH